MHCYTFQLNHHRPTDDVHVYIGVTRPDTRPISVADGWARLECAFSHFPTQSPQTDQRRIHLHRKKNTKTHLRLKGNVKKSDEKQEMRSIESDRNSLQFACQGARTVSTFITLFSRVHATLQPTLSVGRLVYRSVTLSFFFSFYGILSHFRSF